MNRRLVEGLQLAEAILHFWGGTPAQLLFDNLVGEH